MPDPKIEPWMVAAAEEMSQHAGLDALAEYRHDVAVGKIVEIIARHAPDPASVPIGPGDVVQVVKETRISGTFGMRMFAPGQMVVAKSVDQNNVYIYRSYGKVEIPLTHVTRIGRAVYWPDGTRVEGGGE